MSRKSKEKSKEKKHKGRKNGQHRFSLSRFFFCQIFFLHQVQNQQSEQNTNKTSTLSIYWFMIVFMHRWQLGLLY
jgi:hypothetical protein